MMKEPKVEIDEINMLLDDLFKVSRPTADVLISEIKRKLNILDSYITLKQVAPTLKFRRPIPQSFKHTKLSIHGQQASKLIKELMNITGLDKGTDYRISRNPKNLQVVIDKKGRSFTLHNLERHSNGIIDTLKQKPDKEIRFSYLTNYYTSAGRKVLLWYIKTHLNNVVNIREKPFGKQTTYFIQYKQPMITDMPDLDKTADQTQSELHRLAMREH